MTARIWSPAGLRPDPWATPEAALCTLAPGDEVSVTWQTCDGWCRVRVLSGKYEGKEGYIYWVHLSPLTADPVPLWRDWLIPSLVVIGSLVLLYSTLLWR